MARKYDVKGTNDFLIWSVLLFALGIWAVRDGWYPPPSKLEKYPQRVPLHFEIGGTVTEVSARVAQEVKPGDVLARLDDAEARQEVSRAEEELTAAAQEERETLVRMRRQLEAAQAALGQHALRAPTGGVIRAVHVAPRTVVTPEDEAATLDPRHHFYPFNKSLAVFSLLGAIVCLVIHLKVR